MAKATSTAEPPLRLMVSSTVYGMEETLTQIYGMLTDIGYEVWMSHAGTIPTDSNNHPFEDCLKAVDNCHLFFSIISPRYGSGVIADDNSITHQELLRAIRRKCPRWVVVHQRVTLARSILRKLGCYNGKQRRELLSTCGYDDPDEYKKHVKRESEVIDDFRLIDMYESAKRDDIKNPLARKGSWVQPFGQLEEIKRIVQAQFGNPDDIRALVDRHRQQHVAKRPSRRAKR